MIKSISIDIGDYAVSNIYGISVCACVFERERERERETDSRRMCVCSERKCSE